MNIYITRDFYLLRITNYAVYIVRIRKIVWILSIVVVFIIVNFSTSNLSKYPYHKLQKLGHRLSTLYYYKSTYWIMCI